MTLISRKDAIERIANDNVVGGMKRINEYRDSTEHNDYLDGISTAIATVDDLPSAKAKTKCIARIEVDTEEIVRRIKEEYDTMDKWIPCSERLPNEEGLYMVTLKTFSDDYRFIDLLRYGKPMMPNCMVKGACWYRNDSERGDVVYEYSDIIAWVSLPMPYREDGE